MIETFIRPRIQSWFDLMAKKISSQCTANTITLCAFVAGILAGISIAFNYKILGISLILLSGLCDILDGSIARLTNDSSELGAYIDLISDRMVEAAIIIGMAISMPEYSFAYITFFAAVLLHFSTFLAAGALFKNTGNKSMHYDTSLIERAEAFVIFIFVLLFPQYLYSTFLCFNGLIFWCGISRFFRILRLP